MNNNIEKVSKHKTSNQEISEKHTIRELETLKQEMLKLKNRRSETQLNDYKKEQHGFSPTDSVIDVGQGEYGVSLEDDILYTYGIEPCCGVVVYEGEKRILFHLDGKNTSSEVIEIIKSLKFSNKATIIIAPGITCGVIPGSFDYKELSQLLQSEGFNVTEHQIPSTLGFIIVDPKKITIGSLADQSQNAIYKQEDSKAL